jgi:oxygen-independent coproporphyrinogen III oxidase
LAGIYIHIPFCKKICHYCDFYKTATLIQVDQFIESLLLEMEQKRNFLEEGISTIYFGGGTPSVLDIFHFERILKKIEEFFTIEKNVEMSIEINPDDSSVEYFKKLKEIGFNRMSIGIQSFNDRILQFLNRRHNGDNAMNSIIYSKQAGFENISVDLIYGINGQSLDDFRMDLNLLENLDIQHLSAYHLGIEENSYFGKLKKQGRFIEIEEELSTAFYWLLIDWSSELGFDHYEVSNFAKGGMLSKHNKAYWFSVPYLGFGPSAHSFYRNRRSFNISNVNKYIRSINDGTSYYDEEILDPISIFNEYIMLKCRTKWGIDLSTIQQMVNTKNYEKIYRMVLQYKDSNYLRIENNIAILNDKGFLISDYIIKDLINCVM